MNTIGIYTRHKLDKYTLKLADTLRIYNKNIIVFSEDHINNKNIVSAEDFYDYKQPTNYFSNEDINNIIMRCRVLRSLNSNLAEKLIQRANGAVSEMIRKFQFTVIIAPRIDNYFLDILERLCIKNNIKFIGLWRSAFVDKNFFITSRGEFKKVRDPGLDEVNDLVYKLSKNQFSGTSIRSSKYTIDFILLKYIKLYIRAVILEFIRLNSINKYRYRELATRFFVPEYRVNIRDLFVYYGDWELNLNNILSNGRPSIFFALQVNPEATIDYYCHNLELININKITPLIIRILVDNNFNVIIKDHPNMLANRKSDLLEELKKINNNFLVLVPSSVNSNYLIQKTQIVFTWSGTVAIQALMMSKKVISVCVPYYLNISGFFKIDSLKSLAELLSSGLLSNLNKTSEEEKYILASHILSSHLQGEIYTHNDNSDNVDYHLVADNLQKFID